MTDYEESRMTMTSPADRAVAIVGIGAILPDAPDANAFWANLRDGHYSISDVDPARWDPALYYDADPRRPSGRTPRSAAGCASGSWDPLALEAADPAEGRATRWTTPRSGRSPARAWR